MTESYPQGFNADEEAAKLIPADMDKAFTVDGVRRSLEGTWNPEDPQWKEEYEAHRLLMDAGIVKPAIDLNILRDTVARVEEARKAVEDAFEDHKDKIDGSSELS